MMLDGKELKFYQYNGDVNELLDGVRASLNELAEHWTREQKDHCLRETADAFQVWLKANKLHCRCRVLRKVIIQAVQQQIDAC
jgi:hypothetical protein